MAESPRLVVLSGGVDSVTLAYHLAGEGRSLRAIYIDTGYQPRRAERNSAKMAAHVLGIPLEIVDVHGIISMVSGFVPTEYLGMGEHDKGQPEPYPDGKYVVGFPVMLAIASYYALLAGIPEVNVGLIKEQKDHNPGLIPFMANWASTIGPLNPSLSLTVAAPFLDTPKREVIALGMHLSIDYRNTWSCYRGGDLHCGECGGCTSRKDAFANSKHSDPTRYLV